MNKFQPRRTLTFVQFQKKKERIEDSKEQRTGEGFGGCAGEGGGRGRGVPPGAGRRSHSTTTPSVATAARLIGGSRAENLSTRSVWALRTAPLLVATPPPSMTLTSPVTKLAQIRVNFSSNATENNGKRSLRNMSRNEKRVKGSSRNENEPTGCFSLVKGKTNLFVGRLF